MKDDRIDQLPWLPELVEMIRTEVARHRSTQEAARPDVQSEIEELRECVKGYSLSLANPQLDPSVRACIESSWREALDSIRTRESLLELDEKQVEQIEDIVDPALVLERLEHLAEILTRKNATLANVELALHISSIDCHSDGRVVMRTCRLGALSGAQELVTDNSTCKSADTQLVKLPSKPRRRTVRKVDDQDDGVDWRTLAETAADPDRFAGLSEDWFWEDEFQIPRRLSWAEEHAAEVADQRLAGLTHEQLAGHFDKSVPTIRASLKHAMELPEYAGKLVKKIPRRRWHEDHAVEVADLKAQEKMSTAALARHFRKSEPTIQKALEHAAVLARQKDDNPDPLGATS